MSIPIFYDEFGNPFIILREQEKKARLTGNDAIKVCPTHGYCALIE